MRTISNKNSEENDYITDLKSGQDFIKNFDKGVTFYGSSRLDADSEDCKKAILLGEKIAEKNITLFTGGGPGIMEAGMKGAKKKNGLTVGLNIILPNEQDYNDYVTEGHLFKFFFSRKKCLFDASRVLVFFKGGFGTLDEMMEIIDGIATNKLESKPIFLIGKDFYQPIFSLLKEKFLVDNLSGNEIFEQIKITDDIDFVAAKIEKEFSKK